MALSPFPHKNKTLPPVFKEFENINRYWDKMHEHFAAKILPGEYYVTAEDEIIVTVLGSCVSACIRDKVFQIGGMNHFMLPVTTVDFSTKIREKGGWSEATRFGSYAMEMLINDILKHGGRRQNLEIKIFGGGKIISNMTNVGEKNVGFVEEYVRNENLALVSEDTGDIYPRKVVYHPSTGKVKVKRLRSLHNNTLIDREEAYQHEITEKPSGGDIELF